MIRCEKEKGRAGIGDEAFTVHYKTPLREGNERFGGFKAREKATAFAVEILKELLDN